MSEKSNHEQLDDIIEAAMREPEPDAAPEAPADKVEAKPDDGAEPKVGRDERGRFAKKEQETDKADAAPDEATAAEAAPVVEDVTDQTEKTEPAKKWSDGQFRGWSPEQRARFESLPQEQQDAVMSYKAEYDATFTRRDQEHSEFRKQAEPLIELAKQNADLWASQNLAPAQALQGYANIERTLTYGTYDQKVKLFSDIAQAYGIPYDPAMMSLDLDVDQYRARHDSQSEIARIQAENARLQRQFDDMRAESLQSQIAAFAAATDPSGAPKHPHFETVKAAMGGLLSSGQAQTLEQAYEIASKPIADAIAAREAEIRAATQAQQRSSVEKAKKAAPVKTAPTVPGSRSAPASLDDVISEAMSKAGW